MCFCKYITTYVKNEMCLTLVNKTTGGGDKLKYQISVTVVAVVVIVIVIVVIVVVVLY